MRKYNSAFTAALLSFLISGCAFTNASSPREFYSGTKYSTEDLGCYSFGSSGALFKNILFASVLGNTTDSLALNTANGMNILSEKRAKADDGSICDLTLEQAMELNALVSYNAQKASNAEHRSYDHFITSRQAELTDGLRERRCGLYQSSAISRKNNYEYIKGYVICEADEGKKIRVNTEYDPVENAFAWYW